MTLKTDREKYALLMQAAATAERGELIKTAVELLDVAGENTVRTFIRRLESRGFDLAPWYEATSRPRGGSLKSDELLYHLLMQAARKAKPGQLTRVAMDLTGLSKTGLRACRQRLTAQGYDFGDWDAAAVQGQLVGRGMYKPRPAQPKRPADDTPEHVVARRNEWYADIREVSGKPGAIRRLCDKWRCEAPTAKGRIHSLRGLGYDLSWWDANGGRADKAAEVPLQAVSVEPLPLPVVAPLPARKAPPWKPEVPYTMQGIAEIVGMPVMAVRFAARAHGIGFDQWCLAPDVALGLLAALGFRRIAA